MKVRLLHDCRRPDGAAFPAGTVLTVAREFVVNRENERCYSLMNDAGEWVLPCVEVEFVEEVE